MYQFFIIFLAALTSFFTIASSNEVPLKIQQIAPGVYQHTSYQNYKKYGLVDSNGLIIVKDKQAIIIDTPWGETDTLKLLSWLEQQNFKAIASISTHFHQDRTAGLAILNAHSIDTYASKMTNQLLQQNNKPMAKHSFEQAYFKLNQLEIFYPGAGHSLDNLVVWLDEQAMLFGGCLVRSHQWHSLGNTADAKIEAWAQSIENIKNRYPNIKTVIPGHGEQAGTAMLDHTISLALAAQK